LGISEYVSQIRGAYLRSSFASNPFQVRSQKSAKSEGKEKVNIGDPSKIVAITRNTFYKLPYDDGNTKYRYVVTALDRLHNESKPVKKKVKL
jgi:hypothetical protein